ncbi:Hypothetical_protein [Hexamita inflata]|uniref:Hypothetical_protein n=1 Tax=Hexamita inflata TaxID=28002 RepID=A0AA86N9T5_9EUKA|nr:Hypothetical protein HINF_LOCUS3085 [Hexamita inflata]
MPTHQRPNRALTESSADQFYLIRYCGYTYQLQTQFELIWSEINLTYIYQINDNNLHRANIFDFNKYRNYTTQKIRFQAKTAQNQKNMKLKNQSIITYCQCNHLLKQFNYLLKKTSEVIHFSKYINSSNTEYKLLKKNKDRCSKQYSVNF